jgi:hypothetical protein
MYPNPEHDRLQQAVNNTGWKRWGPYLSERQWGTVREDYSPYGDAWGHISFNLSRSVAYRWGEDGIAGVSDTKNTLCFAVALWNGKDPILKERLFGLANPEGNHGEDVKEVYYYLDSTPTHSYLKFLYKYPQNRFPYEELYFVNKQRTRQEPEYELVDTKIFDNNEYFDVFVEYAKADTEDILIKITAHNRCDKEAELHLLPTLWFRNTWSWGYWEDKPLLFVKDEQQIFASHASLGNFRLHYEDQPKLLFTENETNRMRMYGKPNAHQYVKDGIHEYIINGNHEAVNPSMKGTKVSLHYHKTVEPLGKVEIRLRLAKSHIPPSANPYLMTPQEMYAPVEEIHYAPSSPEVRKLLLEPPFERFSEVFDLRKKEADMFYDALQIGIQHPELKKIQRQALAGMMWCKQYYYYNVNQWLKGDPNPDLPHVDKNRVHGRNSHWKHLYNSNLISMPDKWEYPWYAAWDLAFHCIPIARIDASFAKRQLQLMLREYYMHPNGQIPAYEWNFGDVNPPVHAYGAWKVYCIDKEQNQGKGDVDFLAKVFHKLLMNFTWWVNQKDREGNNLFEGGFLGLDNIGVFDRNMKLPEGSYMEQADGTSWMAMYSLNMLRIALELSLVKPYYQEMASKFFEHFLSIAGAMSDIGGEGNSLWDDEDEFFYDVLHTSEKKYQRLKVRSMVGLIPLFAVEVLQPDMLDKLPDFKRRLEWVLKNRPELASLVSRWYQYGKGETRLLSLVRIHRLKCTLRRMLDETEFLSDYGVRALSKYHLKYPYHFQLGGQLYTVKYVPGESDSSMFGGNSNWRGPIWFPVNYMLIESLLKFYEYYGDDEKFECPTGSGNYMNLKEIALQLAKRLIRLFQVNSKGERPIYNSYKFNHDSNFKDYILFHEYFNGDTGKGIGASHQTGWTGLIAELIHLVAHDNKHDEW